LRDEAVATNSRRLTEQIAQHLREVHFGGNWTAVSLQEKLSDLGWQQASARVHSFHPIATLVYHMNYFVRATARVLEGGPLDSHDKYSIDAPRIESQAAWQQLLDKTRVDTERLSDLIEKMPEDQLWEDFVESKNGSYYRCLQGLIEHCHYHLGQIALLRSILVSESRLP
jgi:hypothetical protein